VRVLPHTAKTGSGFRDPARSGVTGIGYDPSGKHLALTFSDGYVDVYTAPDYSNPSFSKKTGSQGATVAAFNRSGSELLTVNDDGKTWVWNLATKKRLARFTVLNNDFLPRNADLSPDGRTIAVGDYGGVLTLIDVRSGRRYELPAADSTLDNVAFSHDGRKIVTSGTKGVVRVWDLARRKSKLLRLTGTAALSYVEFSPDDRSVAAALEDGTIHMWDAQSGDSQVVFQPVTETGYATSLDFSSDGKFLLAAYLDGDARIWKTELARPLDVVERLARQRVSRSLTPAEKKTYLQGK
jgi:WD40 repeat protein